MDTVIQELLRGRSRHAAEARSAPAPSIKTPPSDEKQHSRRHFPATKVGGLHQMVAREVFTTSFSQHWPPSSVVVACTCRSAPPHGQKTAHGRRRREGQFSAKLADATRTTGGASGASANDVAKRKRHSGYAPPRPRGRRPTRENTSKEGK